jgi:hypothetical protein
MGEVDRLSSSMECDFSLLREASEVCHRFGIQVQRVCSKYQSSINLAGLAEDISSA